jgi:16S rRNA (guanine527-N7)-methyltransferase
MTSPPPSIYNRDSMDPTHIADLLQPFLANPLSPAQLTSISIYIDVLLRWNARINLTAVRDPEHIVTRHFGESLFAARHLFPNRQQQTTKDYADLGSGAGFPGLPIKIWAPEVNVTLIESNQKKTTFLREVIRALALENATVFSGRGEVFPPSSTEVVTLRAVERFEQALAVASQLVRPGGRLALLIGVQQCQTARRGATDLSWQEPIPIPLSQSRILLVASKLGEPTT